MKVTFSKFIALGLISLFFSCNQANTPKTTDSTQKSTSEFKDSTSFTKGTKVFITPIAQMKVIDSVAIINGKHLYYISGKEYKADQLKSLD